MTTQNNWAYTDKVKEHFINPKNILADEEDFQHDGKGLIGNIKCGDQMIFVSDNTAAESIGWKPKFAINEGISALISYLRGQYCESSVFLPAAKHCV